jgi:plasmid stabilization system protein ParE
MDYEVRLSKSARSDIQDIVRYISIDDPAQALRFGHILIQHARKLGQFSHLGRVVPEFDDDSIREIIVRQYRVIYRIIPNKRLIEIIRFWHAGRDYPELF